MIFICQQYQYYHFIYFQSFTYLISDILNLTKCNNLQMECFFFSIYYFGWLHKSGKMKWSVCRHEERIIEFKFSSVSKLVWICHILFPAKHFFSLKKFQPTYWWDWSWAFSVPKSCPEPDWNKPWPVQKFFTSRAFYVGLEMAGWLRRHSLPKNSSVSPTVFFFNV